MPTAQPWDAAETRPGNFAAILGKLLAVAIILTPLVMMLFPELNHRWGSYALTGTRETSARRPSTPEPVLNPIVFRRSDK